MVNEVSFAPWDDPAQTPLIEFRGVTKSFGDFRAIDDLTLDIFEREFFALLGPSGCGKTTLMRMLAGFETPSAGTIKIGGQDMSSVPPNRRPVNMMFQSYALFPHLSVWENIAFGLRRERRSRDFIAERVGELLRLTRLETMARRRPDQLSGGQRQRVALARALARAPKLLLLDEPLGALDAKLREATQFELMDIQEKTGTTFVIVTHDQEEAMTVSSRVAVMDQGKIIQVAPPEQVYEAPTSLYVADFIGDANVFSGPVTSMGKARYAMRWFDGQAPLEIQSEVGFSDDQIAHLVIRPEKLSIHKDKPQTDNALPGRVIDIGYLGNLFTFHVELPGEVVVKVQQVNSERYSKRAFAWEDRVWVGWSSTAGVLLAG